MALRPTWPGAETKPPGKEDPAQRGGVTRGTVQLTAHWPLLVVALLEWQDCFVPPPPVSHRKLKVGPKITFWEGLSSALSFQTISKFFSLILFCLSNM